MITKTTSTLHFVDGLISYYSEYDSLSKQYNLSIEDISHHDLCELVSKIMLDDPIAAHEAMGPDNDQYNSKVYPALIGSLSKTSSPTKQQDYLYAMQESLVHYFDKDMRELIEERLEIYNEDSGRQNKYVYNQFLQQGV